MKIGVSLYSFGKLREELGLWKLIDKAAEMGFDGLEFTEDHLNWFNGYDVEIAKEIKAYCAERGIEVANFCETADFLKNDPDETFAVLKKKIDFAAAVGAPCLRHDITSGFGFANRKYSIGYDDAIAIAAPQIRKVTEYAQSVGVKTCTENHGFFSQDATRVEKLINAVAHENFGMLVDMGNFMCADEDPVKSVSITVPYAFHVHAKDFYFKSGYEINPGAGWFTTRANNYLRGAIIGHGDAHIYQSIQILKKNKYDGYVSIEFEGHEDPISGIAQGKANLERFIG